MVISTGNGVVFHARRPRHEDAIFSCHEAQRHGGTKTQRHKVFFDTKARRREDTNFFIKQRS